MTYKKALTLLGILTCLFLSLAMVSAGVLTISDVNAPASVLEDAGSFEVTFNLSYTGTVINKLVSFQNSIINFGLINISDVLISPGESKIITTIIDFPLGYANETILGEIKAIADMCDANANFSVQVNELELEIPGCMDEGAENYDSDATEDDGSCTYAGFCDPVEIGDLKFTDFDVNNLGEGEEDEWYPLDEIEIEVEVENDGEEEIEDVILEIIILDSYGDDVTDDFNFDEEEIDLGDIDDNDEETALFRISELPADLDKDDYEIYVIAYEEGDEEMHCCETYTHRGDKILPYKFDILKIDKNAVVVKEDLLTQTQALAGENVEVRFFVYNVGEEDEDKVLVVIENSVLGLSESEVITNLDVGDRQEITFNFKVPADAEEKTYHLLISTYYDYDEGDDYEKVSYDENSVDDLEKTFTVSLKVLESQAEPAISPLLSSEAKVGRELVVQVSVTNPGSAENFAVSVSGYESWAELVSIEPLFLSLAEDETKELTITLKPTEAGEQTFNIKVDYNGQTTEQSVSVTIKQRTGFLTGAFAGLEEMGNTTLYLIVGIVILLILIILALIVKVARAPRRRPAVEEF